MPKGRGANERRRSDRQKHPSEGSSLALGATRLIDLINRATEVQEARRKKWKSDHDAKTTPWQALRAIADKERKRKAQARNGPT